MKVGIYVGDYSSTNFGFEEMESGYSGSETWALEVARVMVKRGYNVVVFGAHNYENKLEYGVEIRPTNAYLLSIVNNERFDYFIFSRKQKPITKSLNCNHIYVMFHDAFGYRDVGYEHDQEKDDLIEGYGYLSEYQKDNLVNNLHINPEKLHKVTNGFSKSYYNENLVKENSCVWSSSMTRGIIETYELVFRRIKEFVPDFKVYMTYPHEYGVDTSHLPDWIYQYPGVSKEKLAELQLKSKIWVNPGSFPETFCITAVENAYAGNVIVAPLYAGLSDTLNGYPGPLVKGEEIGVSQDSVAMPNLPILDENSAYLYVYHAVKSLTDEDYRNHYSAIGRLIADKYSWERAASEWLDVFDESESRLLTEITQLELS